jgi:hypothetical protein
MTSKIEICSNALLLIGDNPISSFDEGESAALAENLYDAFYDSMMSYHPWTFALKQQRLNVLSEKPDRATGFNYALQIPSDMIYLWKTNTRANYEIIGRQMLTNDNDILATYTYKVAETDLPASFITTMQYRLASEFAQSITENNGNAQIYEAKFRQALSAAMAADSQQRPQQGIIDKPYLDVRNY